MDLIGKKFGRLTVVSEDEKRPGYVICKCDCGSTCSIRSGSLTKTKKPTRSCGCLRKEIVSGIGKRTIFNNSRDLVLTNAKYGTNFSIIENTTPPKDNKSGHKGVWFNPSKGVYEAYISVRRKRYSLGNFTKYDDAVRARQAAEDKLFAPLIEAKRAENNKEL